jgi:isoamylase
MSEEHWAQGFAKSLGAFLDGEAIASRGPRGERIRDDSFYVLFNAHHEPLHLTLPTRDWQQWATVLIPTTRSPRPEIGWTRRRSRFPSKPRDANAAPGRLTDWPEGLDD